MKTQDPIHISQCDNSGILQRHTLYSVTSANPLVRLVMVIVGLKPIVSAVELFKATACEEMAVADFKVFSMDSVGQSSSSGRPEEFLGVPLSRAHYIKLCDNGLVCTSA